MSFVRTRARRLDLDIGNNGPRNLATEHGGQPFGRNCIGRTGRNTRTPEERERDMRIDGAAVFALIDSDTFRVEGYFEETKLRRIRIGEDATVKLIGDPRLLSGHVESIAYGIEDQNRSTSNGPLAFGNPTFTLGGLGLAIPFG